MSRGERPRISERWLLAGLMLFAIVIVSRGTAAMGGAAPHYLAATDSILRDFDLDLSNQYAPDTDYVFYPGPPAAHVRRGAGGQLAPGHEIGLAVLMIPVYGLGQAAAAAAPAGLLEALRWSPARLVRDLTSLFMALLWACTAVLTLRCVRLLGPTAGGRYGEWAVLIAFVTPPMLTMALVVLPETAIAFLTMVFVHGMLARRHERIAVLALAFIPWFAVRYVFISLAGLVWFGLREGPRSRRTLRVFAVVAGSAAALALYSYALYGSVVSITNLDRGVPFSLDHGVPASMGLLFDPDFGLLVIAPFWFISLAGVPTFRDRAPRYLAFVGVAAFGTFVAATFTFEWWGGYSPAGRLVMPVLAAVTPLLGAGLYSLSSGWRRALGFVAVGWALVLTLVVTIEPVNLWTDSSTNRGLLSPRFAANWLQPDAGEPGGDETAANGAARLDPLIMAVQRDALGRARGLLRAGTDVDTTDLRGRTGLMLAAASSRERLLKLFIDEGGTLDARDKDGWTAMAFAAQAGSIDPLVRLIRAGASVDAQTRLGWTPLVLAAYDGNLDIVRRLLRAGADPNGNTYAGMTALIRAARRGHTDVVQLLLRSEADPEATASGRSALQWAILLDHDDTAAVLQSWSTSGARSASTTPERDGP